jgi:glucokinase
MPINEIIVVRSLGQRSIYACYDLKRLQRNVIVENDGNMAALAEAHYGQMDKYRHLLYLTISTGIGGGIIIDGNIYRGRDGGAGEPGHMVIDPRGPVCGCGKRGCLEALASGTALAREANELLQKGQAQKIQETAADSNMLTAKDVSTAAALGDSEAMALVNQMAEQLGIGISNLISIFNPEIVVLGGGVALGMGNMLIKPVADYIHTHTFPIHSQSLPIVLSPLGQYAGLLGCAIAVRENN